MDAERKRVNGLRRNALIEELDGYNLDTTGNVNILRNRLLQYLADQITADDAGPQVLPNLNDVLNAIGSLSANIDQRFQQRDEELEARMKRIEDAINVLEAHSTSDENTPVLSPSDPHQLSSGEKSKLNQGKLCDMARKWNLKFDGKEGAVSFLERLKELQRAYGIEDQKMLNLLPELFSGTATLWYRNNFAQWSTWKEFLDHFVEYFFPGNFHRHLMTEIQNRTQGPNEKVREYFEALGTLMRRHGKLTEDERNEWFFHNLQPEYKLYVRRQNITDKNSLLKLAVEFEETREENLKFRPPPEASNSYMPETAFGATTGKSAGKGKVMAVNGNTAEQGKKPRYCTNCKTEGHNWRQCKEPRRLYCWGCGKDGVTRRVCGCSEPKERTGNDSGNGNQV